LCCGLKALKGRCNLARAEGPGDNITGITSAESAAYHYPAPFLGLKDEKKLKKTPHPALDAGSVPRKPMIY